MNVQKKIFEVLAKKQELGAIDDAINQAKSDLAENLAVIKANSEGLNNITLRLKKTLMDSLDEYDSSFNNVDESMVDKARDDMEDLESYGVETGDAMSIIDNWRDANEIAIDIYNSIPNI